MPRFLQLAYHKIAVTTQSKSSSSYSTSRVEPRANNSPSHTTTRGHSEAWINSGADIGPLSKAYIPLDEFDGFERLAEGGGIQRTTSIEITSQG